MKKKNFFSGFNAKLALTVVALSGALLTGCYKDDGLDVNGPTGETVLPNPVYTIAGNVIDAETLEPIAAATVSGGATATVANGGFSVEVKDPKSYSLTVKADGYEDTNVTVDVKELKAGQSAVYSTLVAMQPKYEGVYNLTVQDVALGVLAAADFTVTDLDGTAITDLTKVPGNATYVIKIAKEEYTTLYVTLDLPKIRANANKVVVVNLTKQPIGKIKVLGVLTMNGKSFSANSIEMYNEGEKLLGVGQGTVYSFEVEASEFKATTKSVGAKLQATFTFVVTDMKNRPMTFKRTVNVVENEEGDSESRQNMTFEVDVQPVLAGNYNETKNVVVDICNDGEDVLNFWVEYTNYTGSVSQSSDYVSKLVGVELDSDDELYKMVVGQMEIGQTDSFATELAKTGEIFEIPASSLLKDMTVVYNFNKMVYTLISINVDGDAIEEYASVANAVNVRKQPADTFVSLGEYGEFFPITHSHSHGHGHGGNQNAGGGIVEAE